MEGRFLDEAHKTLDGVDQFGDGGGTSFLFVKSIPHHSVQHMSHTIKTVLLTQSQDHIGTAICGEHGLANLLWGDIVSREYSTNRCSNIGTGLLLCALKFFCGDDKAADYPFRVYPVRSYREKGALPEWICPHVTSEGNTRDAECILHAGTDAATETRCLIMDVSGNCSGMGQQGLSIQQHRISVLDFQ